MKVMDMRPTKKKIRARRELRGEWPDEKIRELIYKVESRPELWDIGNASYHDHHISRKQSWKELASELGEGYDWSDCRLKWQNLRVTFRSNINKISKIKSGLENDEAPKIQWRFFDAMCFIHDAKEQRQYAIRTDSRDLNVSDGTFKLETEMTVLESQQNLENSQCSSSFIKQESSSPVHVAATHALDSLLTSQQNLENSQCSSSFIKQESPSPLNIAATPPPHTTNNRRKKVSPHETKLKYKNDEHACFGNFIASEFRSLPPEQSFALKRRLNRTLLEFWDDMAAHMPTVAIPKTEFFQN